MAEEIIQFAQPSTICLYAETYGDLMKGLSSYNIPQAPKSDCVRINYPFLRIIHPVCNSVVEYQALTDIPKESVPCPCGDEDHWLIKYGAEDIDKSPTEDFKIPEGGRG